MKKTVAASYTARTTAFIAATGISDTTIINALNTMDLSLISAGLDTKIKALYPFVGGAASTHKYNFMQAVDSDAAFRLQFFGGWVHSSTGAKPNGTNGYAITYYNPRNEKTINTDQHISIYSRTNQSVQSVDFGAYDGVYLLLSLRRSDAGNNSYWGINTSGGGLATLSNDTNSAAFYLATRTGTTTNGWKNSTKSATATDTASLRPNLNLVLGGFNNYGSMTAGFYSSKDYSFSSIGDGLSDSEASAFYTAVQTFQTSLSRNV